MVYKDGAAVPCKIIETTYLSIKWTVDRGWNYYFFYVRMLQREIT